MANDELNQLLKSAREAVFFIRSIDGYENSKIANELSALVEKVEHRKFLLIGLHAARVVFRNNRKAVEHRVQPTPPLAPDYRCICGKPYQHEGICAPESAGG